MHLARSAHEVRYHQPNRQCRKCIDSKCKPTPKCFQLYYSMSNMKADFLYFVTEGQQTFFHDKRNTDDIRTENFGIIDRHRSQIRKIH